MTVRFATFLLTSSLSCPDASPLSAHPYRSLRCDSALAGRWQPVKDGPLNNTVEIGPDCTLRWPDEACGFHRATLTGFTLDDNRYLVFSPTDADRLLAAEGDLIRSAPKGSVFLARYRIDGDSALLWLPDRTSHCRRERRAKPAAVRSKTNSPTSKAVARPSRPCCARAAMRCSAWPKRAARWRSADFRRTPRHD